jgi:hypothetical protein
VYENNLPCNSLSAHDSIPGKGMPGRTPAALPAMVFFRDPEGSPVVSTEPENPKNKKEPGDQSWCVPAYLTMPDS